MAGQAPRVEWVEMAEAFHRQELEALCQDRRGWMEAQRGCCTNSAIHYGGMVYSPSLLAALAADW